jgi:hypothetical protein
MFIQYVESLHQRNCPLRQKNVSRNPIKSMLLLESPCVPILPRESGFMGFKEMCPAVPQNSVRNAKVADFVQVVKMRRFLEGFRKF